MKLYYDEGYPVQSYGAAGEFRLGIPKETPDDLAAELLRKGRLKKYDDTESAPAGADVQEG